MGVSILFRGIKYHHNATHTVVDSEMVLVYNGVSVVAGYPVYSCEVL